MNVGNKFVVDFKDEARLYKEFFALKNISIINYSSLLRLVVLNSASTLSAINFNDKNMLKIIRSVKIKSAHDHDDTGMLVDLWKKSNVVPVHK